MEEHFFTAKDICVSYGKIEALHHINLFLDKGSIVSVIGSNGAGKSTLLKALSGLQPYSGEFMLEGLPLSRKAHRVVENGISYIPEGRRVFAGLTVEENLLAGAYIQKDKKKIAQLLEQQYERFPVLYERRKQSAGTLSGGEQQMLSVGRGLMCSPRLLLLDEPSLGLAPLMINQIFETIETIRREGVTVLLIEQNARRALALCDYAYVIEGGCIVTEGKGEELLNSEHIIRAYLGSKKE